MKQQKKRQIKRNGIRTTKLRFRIKRPHLKELLIIKILQTYYKQGMEDQILQEELTKQRRREKKREKRETVR